jgi:hypothetical protein
MDNSLLLVIEDQQPQLVTSDDHLPERLHEQTLIDSSRHGKMEYPVWLGLRQDGPVDSLLLRYERSSRREQRS